MESVFNKIVIHICCCWVECPTKAFLHLSTKWGSFHLLYVTVLHSHGALDLQPLKKRARSARRKDRTATTEVNKPKEVTDFEEEEESTTKDVMHVFNCLKKACEREGRIHYFTFLVDPMSFAHTVENMFHFAFLIKVRELVCRVEGELWAWEANGVMLFCPCRMGELE